MNRNNYLLNSPNEIHDPGILPAPGLTLAVLPNNKQVLTSSLDFHLRLWDIEKGSCINSWDAGGPIYSIQVIEDANIALLGVVQGIVLWDIENWKLCKENTLWSYSLIYVTAYAEKTDEVIGCGEDTTIHRWNLKTREKIGRLPGHSITITAADIDHSGRFAITGDLTGEIRLWDLENEISTSKWQGHQQKISAIKLTPNGKLALSGSEGGNIILWDLQNKNAVLSLHSQWITDVFLSKDTNWAISCGEDGLSHWDLTQGKQVANYSGEQIIAMSVSPDESILAALVKSNHMLIWDNN